MKKHLNTLTIALVLFAISTSSLSAQNIVVPLRFDRYYTYEEVNQALKQLNLTYPDLTELALVGKSDEGREIWSITVHNPKTGDALDKPAIYIDGNIHGNEIQASEVAASMRIQKAISTETEIGATIGSRTMCSKELAIIPSKEPA